MKQILRTQWRPGTVAVPHGPVRVSVTDYTSNHALDLVELPEHVSIMRRYRDRGSIRVTTWTAEQFGPRATWRTACGLLLNGDPVQSWRRGIAAWHLFSRPASRHPFQGAVFARYGRRQRRSDSRRHPEHHQAVPPGDKPGDE